MYIFLPFTMNVFFSWKKMTERARMSESLHWLSNILLLSATIKTNGCVLSYIMFSKKDKTLGLHLDWPLLRNRHANFELWNREIRGGFKYPPRHLNKNVRRFFPAFRKAGKERLHWPRSSGKSALFWRILFLLFYLNAPRISLLRSLKLPCPFRKRGQCRRAQSVFSMF